MKFLVESNLKSKELYHFISEGLNKRAFLILNACCKVEYVGRAVSRLGLGERTIMVKSDGSFLIHQNINLEPVNWQPPKTKLKVELRDDHVVLTGFRKKPHEKLEVTIYKSYLSSYHIGTDTKSLELAGYEQDMVDMVYKNPEIIESGFRPTATEYSTSNGFIDILGKDQNGNLMVLEFKSRRAGVNAVKQLNRYVETFSEDKNPVRGILIAPSVTDEAIELLENYKLEFKELEPPRELDKNKSLTLDFFSKSNP
ncbi:MAG: endonuclease NucS [Methanomicrobiales archaeon]